MLPGMWCWLRMFGVGSFTWLSPVPGTRPGAGVASVFVSCRHLLEGQGCRPSVENGWEERRVVCGHCPGWDCVWVLWFHCWGVLTSLSVGSLGICVFTEFSFLCSQRISKRPSLVGTWHAKWDGEGIIGRTITGSWGGDCCWSGAVIQPGADVKSVVVSPSGRTLRHSVLRHLWGGALSPGFLCLSTFVCFYRYGRELIGDIFFFILLLYFPDSSQWGCSRNISTSENSGAESSPNLLVQ